MKGVRWIDGQEYLLCGRYNDKDSASRAAKINREDWERVRIIKLNDWDFLIYVHGRK
jgi:hypothetical protein